MWANRSFPLPDEPPRKSVLYAGPVTDTAVELVRDVVEKASRPGFIPDPVDATRAPGRLRPGMTQADRRFSWADPTANIVRRVRAGDGSLGVRAELAGMEVSVFDAHPGMAALDGHDAAGSRARSCCAGMERCWSGPATARSGSGRPPVPGNSRTTDQAAGGDRAGRRVADVPEALDPVTEAASPGRSRTGEPATSVS